MSATLGSGGELERITGIGRIKRIPTPKTSLKHGVCRRPFVFPDLTADSTGYDPWLVKTIGDAERALALFPTGGGVQTLEERLKSVDFDEGDSYPFQTV